MVRADFRSNRPVIEIADVLRRYGDAYRQAHAGDLGRVERRVTSAIIACRTGRSVVTSRPATTAA